MTVGSEELVQRVTAERQESRRMMAEIVHAMRTAEKEDGRCAGPLSGRGVATGRAIPLWCCCLIIFSTRSGSTGARTYGLTGEVGGFRKLVRKPWKVRANEVRLGALQRRCPGHAEHHECRGELAYVDE